MKKGHSLSILLRRQPAEDLWDYLRGLLQVKSEVTFCCNLAGTTGWQQNSDDNSIRFPPSAADLHRDGGIYTDLLSCSLLLHHSDIQLHGLMLLSLLSVCLPGWLEQLRLHATDLKVIYWNQFSLRFNLIFVLSKEQIDA